MKSKGIVDRIADLLGSVPVHGWLPLAACFLCCACGVQNGTLIVAAATAVFAVLLYGRGRKVGGNDDRRDD